MQQIKDFNKATDAEIQELAKDLITKINTDNILYNGSNFKIDNVEVDELKGMLYIDISIPDDEEGIGVYRDAQWQALDTSDMYHPEDIDYGNTLEKDLLASFNTTSTNIDGYDVSLSVNDADVEDIIDVEVDSYSEEDSGIGSYEYWGATGYDSHPYLEVEGTIIQACSCYCTLDVTPIK